MIMLQDYNRMTLIKLISLLMVLLSVIIIIPSSYIPILGVIGISLSIMFAFIMLCSSISKVVLLGMVTTFAALITPSPLFLALTSITGNIFYVIAVFFAGLMMYSQILKESKALMYTVIILYLQIIAVIYWGEIKLIILPFYFLSALLLASAMQVDEINKYIKYSTYVALLLMIGGAIGFIYALFFNGAPLLFISNEDTRQNGLFLTTFSNWYVRGVIRPAGIYDEPGALSFVVCIIAATRHLMGAAKKLTWQLLILGLLTMSIAHIIYITLHLVEEIRSKSFKLTALHWFVFTVSIIVILNTTIGDVFKEFIYDRFKVVDGVLIGDNRSALLVNAYNYLSWPVFFFGLDADCIVKPTVCAAKRYLQFGDNPIGPLVLGGLIQFLAYYCVLAVLFVLMIKKRSYIILGVLFLLLLRNEVMSYGYSLLIGIFLIVSIKYYKSIKVKKVTRLIKSSSGETV